MIAKRTVEGLGFAQVDENEYCDGRLTIFIIDKSHISLISEAAEDDQFICIPSYACNKQEDITDLLIRLDYGAFKSTK